ncbi:MAG: hypothetical protein NZ811_00055 [Gammaproteobacteria bacterium]|nr:hypothetical protein [Gammaproteobacteria bacterium]
MYTAYKVNLDGTLTKKEHLNDMLEIDEWLWRMYDNGVATVRVQKDSTNQVVIFTDNGERYTRV